MLVARGVVTTGSPEHPAFPARWFYGLLRALPGDRAFLPPSPPGSLPRELDASVGASGPHDFAVRITRPSSKAPPRPPHPMPHVRDDRERPSDGHGMAGNTLVIWGGMEAENFRERGWTGDLVICPSGNRAYARLSNHSKGLSQNRLTLEAI